MRTKALLLTAALGFAGAASSMAQAVYSVNVVGYINLTMKPGFNLVANQLNATPNNGLSSVLGVVPDETQVLKFVGNNYTSDSYFAELGGWITPEGNPSTSTISPGEGFFYFNPNPATDYSVTLVGEVRTGNVSATYAPGFNLVSSIVPQQISLTPANGFTPVDELQYLTFNSATQQYNDALSYFTELGGWITPEGSPSIPTPAVGQGFFLFNPSASSSFVWPRTFSPNN